MQTDWRIVESKGKLVAFTGNTTMYLLTFILEQIFTNCYFFNNIFFFLSLSSQNVLKILKVMILKNNSLIYGQH